MAHKLFYTRSAVKDIRRLDSVVKKKIKQRIETYSKNPHFYARKLHDSRIGNYRWRIGDYRVVFDMDNKNIVILKIRHRKEVYK